jgi:hypothetical protein
MASSIQVEAARIPDRDRLLRELRDHDLKARPVNEVGIEVAAADDGHDLSDEVFAQVEDVIMRIGAPFVPIKHQGVIYIRPPLS